MILVNFVTHNENCKRFRNVPDMACWHVAQLITDIIYKLENCVKIRTKFCEIDKILQD